MTKLPLETFDWFLVLLHLFHIEYEDENEYFGLYTVGGTILNINLSEYPECEQFTEFAEGTASAVSHFSGAGMNDNGAVELVPKAAELLPPVIELDLEQLPSMTGMPSSFQVMKCRLTPAGRERCKQVTIQFSAECLSGIRETIRLTAQT